ncbi:tyrosine-type recombinase/integrase [Streptomyces sp. SCUT-3]|uniref:tyrosine-type recombinase/integrase n=1 Tax=Streptomyces sp. SCUT-3 TaxID=2684469 RepID=UPI000CC31814|nr:tyrosine-type recombinase/integrase [Streptomyces sp. SCUT-3]PLW72576.1 mobile element protein [Streptomyces sp. DJ]QMV23366.1 tyrosine-type recombinase/integrase [Streptomyces sp. SCUT-3]
MDTTYDVRIWKISAYKGKRGTTYTVRWAVAGERRRETFATFAQADAFRAELVGATRRGEAFSLATGLPVSHRSGAAAVSWYDFAVQFVDAKWSRSSANNRKNVAKAFMTVTVALLRSEPRNFRPVMVRTALREWAFNRNRRDGAPPEVAAVLRWVERNTLTMAAWEDPTKVEEVMEAIATKLDGTPAAASTVKRNRRVLNVALEYAVKRGVLKANPLPKGKGTSPRTSTAVDKRSLLNPVQAAALLGWIRSRPRGGPRLHAFFATLYYAGLRPEEAVALRVRDAHLPPTGWGELLVHTATPEVGRRWTDSGQIHDTRHLKGRAQGDTRPVPCHPSLAAILREHIADEGLRAGDRLFNGEKGGVLAGSVFRRAWEKARKEVLAEDLYASPLGKRVYDLRHTCLTTWLNNGVPPAQVAEWAGNSVAVLLATYARCISGQTEDLQRRIEAAQDISGLAPEPESSRRTSTRIRHRQP